MNVRKQVIQAIREMNYEKEWVTAQDVVNHTMGDEEKIQAELIWLRKNGCVCFKQEGSRYKLP